MSIHISPNYTDEKLDAPEVEDLIDVFEDRVRGWALNPAKDLVQTEHGRVAGFCLVQTYFEGIWGYMEGSGSKDRSREFFEKGFVDVFRSSRLREPLLLRVARILYEDARCGFFHEGMFRERLYFADLSQAEILVTLPRRNAVIDENGRIESLLIDPKRFHSAVERHFDKYVRMIRDKASASQRRKFEIAFKERCDWEALGPVIGIDPPAHNVA